MAFREWHVRGFPAVYIHAHVLSGSQRCARLRARIRSSCHTDHRGGGVLPSEGGFIRHALSVTCRSMGTASHWMRHALRSCSRSVSAASVSLRHNGRLSYCTPRSYADQLMSCTTRRIGINGRWVVPPGSKTRRDPNASRFAGHLRHRSTDMCSGRVVHSTAFLGILLSIDKALLCVQCVQRHATHSRGSAQSQGPKKN